MPTVKLTGTELAALDAMIATLKEQRAIKGEPVPLRDFSSLMVTTAVIDAIKVTEGARVLPADLKILAEAGKLVAKLKSQTSLEDLLELRKSAMGKKTSAS
jgi:hypothetical protein